jgi:hypothetical protein
MYSNTITPNDLQLVEMQKIVPDVRLQELYVAGEAVLSFPTTRPWLTPLGVGLINITSIRRGSDGRIEFQLADEKAIPYDNGQEWRTADKFWGEWPQ